MSFKEKFKMSCFMLAATAIVILGVMIQSPLMAYDGKIMNLASKDVMFVFKDGEDVKFVHCQVSDEVEVENVTKEDCLIKPILQLKMSYKNEYLPILEENLPKKDPETIKAQIEAIESALGKLAESEIDEELLSKESNGVIGVPKKLKKHREALNEKRKKLSKSLKPATAYAKIFVEIEQKLSSKESKPIFFGSIFSSYMLAPFEAKYAQLSINDKYKHSLGTLNQSDLEIGSGVEIDRLNDNSSSQELFLESMLETLELSELSIQSFESGKAKFISLPKKSKILIRSNNPRQIPKIGYRTEQRQRTVSVPFVDEDGQTRTRIKTQNYTVSVPFNDYDQVDDFSDLGVKGTVIVELKYDYDMGFQYYKVKNDRIYRDLFEDKLLFDSVIKDKDLAVGTGHIQSLTKDEKFFDTYKNIIIIDGQKLAKSLRIIENH